MVIGKVLQPEQWNTSLVHSHWNTSWVYVSVLQIGPKIKIDSIFFIKKYKFLKKLMNYYFFFLCD